jgi:hypothetical protein
MLLEDGVN